MASGAKRRHRSLDERLEGVFAEESYAHDEPEGELTPSTKAAWADMGSTLGGVLLLISAVMGCLHGFAAIDDDEIYAAGNEYLYGLNLTAWGWIHVIVGVLSAIVAIGVLLRTSWGQITGVVVAGLSMIGNFMVIPLYPLWSVTLIGVDLLVMWALLTQLGKYK